MKGRPPTGNLTDGQRLFMITNAAFQSRHELMMDKPKICSKCGRSWSYLDKQRYKLASGEKVVSENYRESWYKYGKYGYICKKCNNARLKERKKQEKMYRIG